MKVLMIFIDGFGLGDKNEKNPYHLAKTPFLDNLLGGHLLYRDSGKIERENVVLIPTDSLLNVAGIPQSATGQTTLWTGCNAAQIAGEHINAFPTIQLQEIISAHSLMKILNEQGKKVTFANAYRNEFFEIAKKKDYKFSTSTLVALSSKQALRNFDDLAEGNAVYQDFTNKLLTDWGYDVKIITPRQAGGNLAGIAVNHDFTLYEYFISDHTGHKQDMPAAVQIYENFDAFFSGMSRLDLDEILIIIVSDHGNIEDLSINTHTFNPVPTIIIHNNIKAINYDMIRSLTDITPFVLQVLGMEEENNEIKTNL